MARVLVVDSHAKERQKAAGALKTYGYITHEIATLAAALTTLKNTKTDAVVVDAKLENNGAWALLIALSAYTEKPVVVFYARRHSTVDAERCLSEGAADYVGRKDSFGELHARLTLRLSNSGALKSYTTGTPHLNFGNLELNPREQSVRVNGRQADLTEYEYLLLEYLMKNKDSCIPKEKLLKRVWNEDGEANKVKYVVRRLRENLFLAGSDVTIANRRNRGYWLEPCQPLGPVTIQQISLLPADTGEET